MAPLPIIAFANTRWNSLWMNRQHLLSRLAARGHPVAYSNGTRHYGDLRAPLTTRFARMDGVMVMRPGYLWPHTYRATRLRRMALDHHCRLLRESLALAPGAAVIGMCFDPDLLDFVDALAPRFRVFHVYDAYNRMAVNDVDFAAVGARIRAYDLVTASSAYMYQELLGAPPPGEVVVPNGVDYASIVAGPQAGSPTARAIAALPGPRIGYVGSVNSRIDFELVYGLATTMPGASFVFVGPVRNAVIQRQPADFRSFQRLRSLPNVHLFGEVPRAELGAVLAAIDVHCIFFRTDRPDWVSAVYPIKLNEYLATGKPVLSTEIKVAAHEFSGVLEVCGSFGEWVSALGRALRTSSDPALGLARQQVAQANDWARRVDQLEALLAAMVG